MRSPRALSFQIYIFLPLHEKLAALNGLVAELEHELVVFDGTAHLPDELFQLSSIVSKHRGQELELDLLSEPALSTWYVLHTIARHIARILSMYWSISERVVMSCNR